MSTPLACSTPAQFSRGCSRGWRAQDHSKVPPRHHQSLRRQRGVSLFIVLIILILALILVLGGLMVANMNESIVGNQADAQRTYSAAQALLDTAERDIRLNGRYCGPDSIPFGSTGTNTYFTPTPPPADAASGTLPSWPGPSVACTLRFPRDMSDFTTMAYGNSPGLDKCVNGVCISSGPTDPNFALGANGEPYDITQGASIAQQWNSTTDNGISYIGATNNGTTNLIGAAAAPAALPASAAVYGGGAQAGSVALSNIQGRYWVEVFPFATMTTALNTGNTGPTPDSTYPFVFRITAMARGLKGGTVSVLRTYYMPYTAPAAAAPAPAAGP